MHHFSVSQNPIPADTLPDHVFSTPRSFSEVENARAQLTGLFRRDLYEWNKRWVAHLQLDSKDQKQEMELNLIQELNRGMEEFHGTEPQFLYAERLLMVYSTQEKIDQWLDLYLSLIYQNPSHRIVTTHIQSAVKNAKIASREKEMLEAIEHLMNIPSTYFPKPEPVKFAALSLRIEESKGVRLSQATPFPEGGMIY